MKIQLIGKIFTAENGNEIPYTRLKLSGSVSGSDIATEIKVTQEQESLIKLLLSSEEQVEVNSHKATPEEEEFFQGFQEDNSDKIDLEK